MDPKTCKRFKDINWTQNKRFLLGALLLLTKEDCRSFIVAIVLDRDEKLLQSGKIAVYLHNSDVAVNKESYVMFESEVFFQPYYNVLKALQHPTFSRHLAMSKYILKVEAEPKPPAYLNHQSKYSVMINDREVKFNVLHEETWPTARQLGLNDSQYAAYKLALTYEFAIIQGPPGTGKTFLGIKVARALLENYAIIQEVRTAVSSAQLNTQSRVTNRPILHSRLPNARKKITTVTKQACIMLLVCYTNHALDQFLEAILPITDSIVRIGGQSHSDKLTKYNIKNVRIKSNLKGGPFKKLRYELNKKLNIIRSIQECIDLISDNNIIDYKVIRKYAPESRAYFLFIHTHLHAVGDPLMAWLFEGEDYKGYDDFLLYINMCHNDQSGSHNRVSNKQDLRKSITKGTLDDVDDVTVMKVGDIKFSLAKATRYMKIQMKKHNSCKDRDEAWMQCEITMKATIKYIKIAEEMFKLRKNANYINLDLTNMRNMGRLGRIDRWSLYFRWAEIVQSKCKEMLEKHQHDLEEQIEAYEEARMMEDLRVIRFQNIKVVGMTTSGAARNRKFLEGLAPPIVIVEEAAEVLEAHIVTSLTENCKHLILIGDHQQLRPSASYVKLARDYNIEVSLFERMILNGMHSSRLDVQHRMRPEIAALISPHIYQHLDNHPKVHTFPNVRGVTKNLFFLSHDYIEEQANDNSKRNKMEGDITLAFANYLMKQGYSSEDITILATYTGQILYMKSVSKSYDRLGEVKITSVDNYQGEESKIILLSLVRNNAEGKIGFLGTENRICVALSRAREGFYMFGNIEILKKNKLWNNIAKTLKSNESIGKHLTLRCENHRNHITIISSVEDFKNVPEGGCLEKCNSRLPKCGHPCKLLCHAYDLEHEEIKCTFKCERICENGHVCPLMCGYECTPCKVPMVKYLRCGHPAEVPCHQDPREVKCMAPIPHCGHGADDSRIMVLEPGRGKKKSLCSII